MFLLSIFNNMYKINTCSQFVIVIKVDKNVFGAFAQYNILYKLTLKCSCRSINKYSTYFSQKVFA